MPAHRVGVVITGNAKGGVDAINLTEEQLKSLNQRAKRTGKSTAGAFDGLKKSIFSVKGALAGIGVGAFAALAKEAVQTADHMRGLETQIKLAAQGLGDYRQASEEIFAISQRTGVQLEATVGLFRNLARSASEIGATQTDILKVTETIQQLGVISRASTTQMQAGLLQFGQAMAGTHLRAEEFNSMVENIPELVDRIAKGMGMTRGEFSRAVREGKILSAEIFPALQSQSEEIAKQFSEMPMTLGRASNMLANAMGKFVLKLDEALGLSQAIADALAGAAKLLEDIVRRGGIALMDAIVGASSEAKLLGDALSDTRLRSGLDTLEGYVAQLSLVTDEMTKLQEEMDRTQGAFDFLHDKLEQGEELTDHQRVAYGMLWESLSSGKARMSELEEQEEKLRIKTGMLQKETEKLGDQMGKTGDASKKLATEMDQLAKKLEEYEDLLMGIDKEERKHLQTISEVNRMVGLQMISQEKAAEILYMLDAAYLETTESARQMTTAVEENAQEVEKVPEIYRRAAESIYDAFRDAFRDIFQGGTSGFEEFVERIKKLFLDMLADLAVMAIARPIIVPIVSGLGQAMGMSPGAIGQMTAQLGGGALGGFNPFGGVSSSLSYFFPSMFASSGAVGLPASLGASGLGLGAGASGSGILAGAHAAGSIGTGTSFFGALAGLAPVLGLAAVGLPFLSSLFGSEPDPRFTIGGAVGAPTIAGVQDMSAQAAEKFRNTIEKYEKAFLSLLTDAQREALQDYVPKGADYAAHIESETELSAVLLVRINDSLNQVDQVFSNALHEAVMAEAADSELSLQDVDRLVNEVVAPMLYLQRELSRISGQSVSSANVVALLEGAENAANMAQALVGLAQALRTNPIEIYTEQVRRSNLGLIETLREQARSVVQLAKSFDGSLGSVQAMTGAMQSAQSAMVSALKAIDEAAESVSEQIEGLRDRINLDLLDNTGKIEYYREQVIATAESLKYLTSPEEVRDAVGDILRNIQAGWALLSNEEKQRYSGFISTFIDAVDTEAQRILGEMRQDVVTGWDVFQDRVELLIVGSSEEFSSVVGRSADDFASTIGQAATTLFTAANQIGNVVDTGSSGPISGGTGTGPFLGDVFRRSNRSFKTRKGGAIAEDVYGYPPDFGSILPPYPGPTTGGGALDLGLRPPNIPQPPGTAAHHLLAAAGRAIKERLEEMDALLGSIAETIDQAIERFRETSSGASRTLADLEDMRRTLGDPSSWSYWRKDEVLSQIRDYQAGIVEVYQGEINGLKAMRDELARTAADVRGQFANIIASLKQSITSASGELPVDILRSMVYAPLDLDDPAAIRARIELAERLHQALLSQSRGLSSASDAFYSTGTALDSVADSARSASRAATTTADTVNRFADSILRFVRKLRTEQLQGSSPGTYLAGTESMYLSTLGLARRGDPGAMGQITESAERYLTAARSTASSRLEYQQILGTVANQVEGLASVRVAASTDARYVGAAVRSVDSSVKDVFEKVQNVSDITGNVDDSVNTAESSIVSELEALLALIEGWQKKSSELAESRISDYDQKILDLEREAVDALTDIKKLMRQWLDSLNTLRDPLGGVTSPVVDFTPSFQGGGIARGPRTGYLARLHGTEAVIPLRTSEIPVKIDYGGLIKEIQELRNDIRVGTAVQVRHVEISARMHRKWDVDGMPETRT